MCIVHWKNELTKRKYFQNRRLNLCREFTRNNKKHLHFNKTKQKTLKSIHVVTSRF